MEIVRCEDIMRDERREEGAKEDIRGFSSPKTNRGQEEREVRKRGREERRCEGRCWRGRVATMVGPKGRERTFQTWPNYNHMLAGNLHSSN